MRSTRTFLSIVVAIISLLDLYAQPQRYRLEHITLEDGLPESSVYEILQDQKGFLWVGTRDGLGRYDGYGFTVYRPGADPGSISDRTILALHEDSQGNIWIGTANGGLNKLDPATGSFVSYSHDENDPHSISSNHVGFIFEDSYGWLWLITDQGLNVLDPETGNIRRFFHDPDRPETIAHDNIFFRSDVESPVYEDREGNIWIGTLGGGISKYERKKDSFSHYRHDPDDPESLSCDYVISIYEAPGDPGFLWIGTANPETGDGGLNRLEIKTGRIKRFLHDPLDANSISSNLIGSAHEDRSGTLWVTTIDGGLNRYDRETNTFTRFQPDSYIHPAPQNSTFTILEDRYGTFWCLSFSRVQEGEPGAADFLTSFDPITKTFTTYTRDPGNPSSLNTRALNVVYEDRGGVLWIGGAYGSLEKLDRSRQKFLHYQHDPDIPSSLSDSEIQALFEDRNGTLWVGTWNGGLNRFNRSSGTFTHFIHDPDDSTSIGANWIFDITEDRSGNLWIATRGGGLNRFDRKTGQFERFTHNPDKRGSLSSNHTSSVLIDRNGTIWVGTIGSGLDRYDPANNRFVHYRHNPNDPSSLASDVGAHMMEDSKGRLWVSSHSVALSLLDKKTGKFKHFKGPVTNAGAYEDREGNIWVGTNAGLYRLDMEAGRLEPFFTTKDGLPNDGVQAILGDSLGYLWISTRNGLCRLDPETRAFRNFTVSDGLQSGRFYHPAALTNRGELVFGGINGFNIFDPESIVDNPYPPSVVLTSFSLFNQLAEPGNEGLLNTPIEQAQKITLKHDQNDISIEYVGLHFSNPSQNRYAYMLENYDSGWRDAGFQRVATYTNLEPGHYIFRVKAANADGIWNENGASIDVVIRPPWWQTIWAYLAYSLLFIASLFAAYSIQRAFMVRREEEKSRERELQHARQIEQAYRELEAAHATLKSTQAQLVQSQKLASLGQLTAGIAHEIRNPMNFVNNFAVLSIELTEELRKECEANPDIRLGDVLDIIEELNQNASRIARHGKRADTIVQSMLEHSRGGRGTRRVVRLNSFVDEYVNLAYHGMRATAHGFKVKIERLYDSSIDEIVIIPQDFGRALLNLLNNAFYAMHQKVHESGPEYVPIMFISTRKLKDSVEIRIQDNGPGIPESIRDKIFEPFFTTKPAGEGTGLGLSLTYDIVVQGHGGTLSLENQVNAGATFVITLPKTSLKDEFEGGNGSMDASVKESHKA